MTGIFSSLFVLLLSCSSALAQTTAPAQGVSSSAQSVQFNQVLNINGDMQINSFQFPDRSKIETFSQKQQQIIVNQNTPSIPPNQVTGSSGQPFVALMQQSMVINTNGATDLVGGQIELALNQQMLQQNAVNPDNAYVAKLSPDRQTWMIQESMRSVNITDNTVRMVKRQQLDGEYIALGRQTVETNTLVTPFGSGPNTQVAIQGSGLQENEFQDGFRMSIRATQPMTMNVDVKKGVDSSQLTALPGQQSVNDYKYSVTTNLAGVQSSLNRQVTVVQMPINPQRILSMMQAMGIQPGGQVQLSVAQRGVLLNPGGATGQLSGLGTAAPPPQRRGRVLLRRQIDPAGALLGLLTGNPQAAAGAANAGAANAGAANAGAANVGAGKAGNAAKASATKAGAAKASASEAGAAKASSDVTAATPPYPVASADPQAGIAQPSGSVVPQAGTAQPSGSAVSQAPPPAQSSQAGTPTNGNNPVAAQLLLSPTFTPITAQVILDTANMRVAFPVTAVDGEYILTMQTAAAQPQAQAQPQQQQQPAAPQAGQAPPQPAQGEVPRAESVASSNGTASGAEGQRRPARRQLNSISKETAPMGSVFITMREVTRMVEMEKWGGQAPISQMMNDFMKSVNGRSVL